MIEVVKIGAHKNMDPVIKFCFLLLLSLTFFTRSAGQAHSGDFELTAINDSPIFRIATFNDKKYFVCEIEPGKYNIELFNVVDPANKEHTFYAIDSVRKNNLVLIVNGGMFMEDLRPLGLYISNGTTFRSVRRDTAGYGNFYMQPNGIFLLDSRSNADVVTTKDYSPASHKAILATQSGPMLVSDSIINNNFRQGSANLNIRNGVGVNDKGNIVFVTSRDLVNFFEFAALYRDHLKCDNALYLDGAVSQYYSPSLNKKPTQTFPLGVFIVVSTKK